MNTKSATEHFDVLILGGGISGISAAHYLWQKQHQTGNRSDSAVGRQLGVALIEAQERYVTDVVWVIALRLAYKY